MSIRAYITRENYIWVDEDEMKIYHRNDGTHPNLKMYTHTDEEYCFNLWRDNTRELLLKYGAEDYTNEDNIGDLEIGYDDFDELYNTEKECNEIDKHGQEWEAILKMKKYFEEGNNWLILRCY